MPTLERTVEIDADPERVWALAGDPGRIADWLPALASSSAEGSSRSCTLADGGEIEELILERSDAERRYRYEVLRGPLPVSSYFSTFAVEERDGRALVRWSADFEPQHEGGEREVARTLEQIYDQGLASLRDKLAAGG